MIYYIFFIILLAGALWCSYCISIADFRRRIIPDAYLFPLMLIGLIMVTCYPWWPFPPYMAAIGAAFGYAMSSIIGIIFDHIAQKKAPNSPAPIGMGDIKLIATAGIWLGVRGLAIALALACIGAMIWAKIRAQKYVPFGPFLIGGGILALIGLFFLL